MNTIFFGSPSYVLPILTEFHRKFVTGPGKSPVVGVVTQKPKPIGRKQILTYTDIDKWAHNHKIDIFYDFDNLPEAELGICASFGQIIPQKVIGSFKFGILNIHPSLLPKYRGASPVTEAIKNGDQKTGVTIIKMDEKMDHGPIVTQFKEEIKDTDTTEDLRNRLFERSADVLIEMIEPYIKGRIKLKKQDDAKATFTKLLKKEDGLIDLKGKTPEEIDRFIRAMYPWPCAWTYLPNQKRVKLLPNDMVQLEGKTPVSKKQFSEAYKFALFL